MTTSNLFILWQKVRGFWAMLVLNSMTVIVCVALALPLMLNAQSVSQSESAYLRIFDELDLTTGYCANHAYLDHDQVESFFLSEGEELSARDIKTSYGGWQQLYRDMRRAGTNYFFPPNNITINPDYPNRFPELSEVVPNQSRANAEVPIGIIFMDTDYVHGDSIEYYLNADSTLLRPETPINIVNFLNISNLRARVYFLDVVFKIDIDFLFSNRASEILGLHIDFNDGIGMREFDFMNTTIPISYSTYGKKNIRYNLITSTDTLLCTSEIEICPIFTYDFEEYITIPIASGDTASVQFNVFLGCDEILDRPVLIVGGFEILRRSDPLDRYERYLKNGLAEYLKGAGYDIVTVGFSNTHLPMERNAEGLQGVIERINNRKVGHHENIIIGESMGGIISRICLRSMENQGLDHQTRLYVSFDAPHKGANTPLSIQETTYDALNANASSFFASIIGGVVTFFTSGTGIVGALFGAEATERFATNLIEGRIQGEFEDRLGGAFTLEDLDLALGASSTTEVSIRNRYTERSPQMENDTISPTYVAFQHFLDTLGFPQKCRNISLINGSNTASCQALTKTIDDMSVEIELMPGDSFINVKKKNVLTYALVSFTDTNNKLVSAISRRKNRFFFNIQEEGKFSFGSRNFDISPGSLPSSEYTFSFVPSASGIALNSAMFETPNGLVLYNDDVSGGGLSRAQLVTASLVPFDDIYAQSKNTRHLEYQALGAQVKTRFQERELMLEIFDLQNQVISSGQQLQVSATELVSAGADVNYWSSAQEPKLFRSGDVIVEDAAALTLHSEQSIRFKPGFGIAAGGQLEASIVASVSGCPQQRQPYAVSNPMQNVIAMPDLNSWVIDGTLLANVANMYSPAKRNNYTWELIGLDTYITSSGYSFRVENLPSGYYTLTCSLYGGVKSNSTIVHVLPYEPKSLGIKTNQKAITHANTLYPNPTSNTLQWTDGQVYQVHLYDTSGRLVREFKDARAVDLSGLPSGPYAIVLRSLESGLMIKEIIVKE